MVLDWSQCEAVESGPGKLGGAWVFRRTRIPVSVVFENMDDGLTISEIVALYEGLTLGSVHALLDFACRSLETPTPARWCASCSISAHPHQFAII